MRVFYQRSHHLQALRHTRIAAVNDARLLGAIVGVAIPTKAHELHDIVPPGRIDTLAFGIWEM